MSEDRTTSDLNCYQRSQPVIWPISDRNLLFDQSAIATSYLINQRSQPVIWLISDRNQLFDRTKAEIWQRSLAAITIWLGFKYIYYITATWKRSWWHFSYLQVCFPFTGKACSVKRTNWLQQLKLMIWLCF